VAQDVERRTDPDFCCGLPDTAHIGNFVKHQLSAPIPLPAQNQETI
jgi:hypothetical protein